MGVSKYRAYLNFHYGVVLEEALQLAAEEYARKLHMARATPTARNLVDDAFRHLYTQTPAPTCWVSSATRQSWASARD